jgi:hypothetical protein
MIVVVWEVSLLAEVEEWFLELCERDPDSAARVAEAIDLLVENGPALGRPAVDRLKGSRYHNMKELRPGSVGSTEIRLIFAFDPRREAIILVAGDKSGAWQQWYLDAIPLADERYTAYLAEQDEHSTTDEDEPPAKGGSRRRKEKQ